MGRGKEGASTAPFFNPPTISQKKGGKDIVTTKVLGHDRVTRLRDSRPLLR